MVETNTKPVRVIVVDDHEIVREGIVNLLRSDPSIEVVAEASSGQEAIAAVLSTECDVLLMDMSMQDMSAIEVLHQLNERSRRPNTLILTMHRSAQFLSGAMNAGALGYITKGANSSFLLYAVHGVAQGLQVVDPSAQPKRDAYDQKLSERERVILAMILDGYETQEIAEQLFISPKTVATHRANIMAKLQVSTKAELFRKIREANQTT